VKVKERRETEPYEGVEVKNEEKEGKETHITKLSNFIRVNNVE